jgi:hypothetical protein
MRRLIAASLVMTAIAAGVAPCAASAFTKPTTGHDCCDPQQVSSPVDTAAPVLAASSSDCCLVMPASQSTADVPTKASPVSNRGAVLSIALEVLLHIRSIAPASTIDRHARSSPRPPLVTVLLI